MKTRRSYLMVACLAFTYLAVKLFWQWAGESFAPASFFFGVTGSFCLSVALLSLFGFWRNERELRGIVGKSHGAMAAFEALVWIAVGTGVIAVLCFGTAIGALASSLNQPFWTALWVVPICLAGLCAGVYCYRVAWKAIRRISSEPRHVLPRDLS
ncbi:MAG: hypothetical protein EOP11_07325 [Proteobacteria bacterium]|nr:MAG: hypothetical protein EOP11_07325 [Pseudomonadota bacterium]